MKKNPTITFIQLLRTKFKNKIKNIMQKKREEKKSYLNLIASKVKKRKEKINSKSILIKKK
jgi:hypothetical protein